MLKPKLFPIYVVIFGFISGLGMDLSCDTLFFGGLCGACVSFFATLLAYLDGKF